MIHKTRAFGLALVAMVAMSASVAQMAHAVPQFTASGYPATVEGTGESIGERIVTEAGAVECGVVHYAGTLAAASTTLRLHPTFTSCKAFGFLEATVTTTGCDYILHATERVKENHFKAHVGISCEAGKAITISASTCAAKIESQENLTSADLTNLEQTFSTPRDITLKWTVKKVKYTVTNDGFLCPFNGTGAKEGGEIVDDEDTESTVKRVTLRCTAPPGTFITCEVSGE